jgi:hypothetical protein
MKVCKTSLLRKLLKWILLPAILYAALVCALLVAMYQPPPVFGRIMARVPDTAFAVLPFKQLWFIARRGHLNVGDRAPDFSLWTADRVKLCINIPARVAPSASK